MKKKNKLFFYVSIISGSIGVILLIFLFAKFIQHGFDSNVSVLNFAFSHGYGALEILFQIFIGIAMLSALISLFLKHVLKQDKWY